MSAASPRAASALSTDVTVISLVGFAHATSHVFHLLLPSLFPLLMADFALSYTQAGSMMTVFFAVSGIGQALAGFLVDRWGAHRVLCLGVGTLPLSGLLLAAAPGVWGLYLAALVAGLGNSVFHPADFALLNRRVSPARLGHAFSVHGLSGNLGWAMGSITLLGVATACGWRMTGVAAAAVGAFALTVLWQLRAVLADAPARTQGTPGEPRKGRLVDLRGLPLVSFAFLFFFLSTLVFGALQNFAPSLFREVHGLTLAVATSALVAYLLGSAAGIAAGGFLAGGQGGEERLVSATLFGAALLALALALATPPACTVIAIMATMGFCVGLAGPSRDMLIRRAITVTLGSGAFGRVYGLVYSGLDVGLASAPLLFGALLDAGQPRAVFMGAALALVGAVAAARAVSAQARKAEESS